MDTTYCIIIHTKEHVEHVIVESDKPNIKTVLSRIEELKNDSEFEFLCDVDDLFIDIQNFAFTISILPDMEEVLLKAKEEL